MTRCIFNDQWADLGNVSIPIQSDAVQYGVGLFETLRTYHNKCLPFLDAHIHRLHYSMADLQLECPYSEQQIRNMVQRLVEGSEHELQRLKILVIPDGVLVTSVPLMLQEQRHFSLTIWQGHRGMAQHKTTSYIDCHLAWQMAQINGYDDSILVDDEGQIYETSRANLFWVNKGKIYTREHHVLPGVMRDFVLSLENFEACFENISLSDLMVADEVFITNSIRGIVPVTLINDQDLNNHSVTSQVQKQLNEFVLNH